MRWLARLGSAALALWLLAAPRLAAACAVCTAGREDENQAAFLWTTLFLSVLPLGMLGAGIWLLVRRARRLAPPAPGPERTCAPAPPAGVTRAPSSP